MLEDVGSKHEGNRVFLLVTISKEDLRDGGPFLLLFIYHPP